MIKLFTKINKEDLLDGDVVKIEFMFKRKSMAKSNYGKIEKYSESTEHAIYQDGKLISVSDGRELTLLEKEIYIDGVRQKSEIEYYLHNYKFVSKEDEWYIEGTEAYPDFDEQDHTENWKEDSATLFQGFTYENNSDVQLKSKRWDGEYCLFREFEITERYNQTRQRKLNRIINDR